LGASLQHTPTMVAWGSGIKLPVSLAYAFTDGRTETNGFEGTTAGDPRSTQWSAIPTSPHAVLVRAAVRIPDWFTLSASYQLRSGFSYTPLVNADINGDGLVNDRAFVFEPSTAPDSTLRAGMAALLSEAPRGAVSCLRSQLREIASEHSCRAHWNQSMQMAVIIDPARLGIQHRGSVSLALSNPLAGLDRLLHGQSDVRGWGQWAIPDATLLTVRGFDPARNAFRYAVNPMFGSTLASRSTFGTPFRVTLDIRLELGRDRQADALTRYLYPPSSDSTSRFDSEAIKAQLLRRARQPHAIDLILRIKDSLHLSATQVSSLSVLGDRYQAVRDSIFASLAADVATPSRDVKATWWRFVAANLAVGRSERELRAPIRSILSVDQAEVVFRTSGPLRGRAILMDAAELERYFRHWRWSPY